MKRKTLDSRIALNRDDLHRILDEIMDEYGEDVDIEIDHLFVPSSWNINVRK